MKTSLYPQAVLAACLSLANVAWAQAIDPWLADGINRANEQARQHNARELQKMRARAWEARERKVQAEIAKHRATPYYMAIAYDFEKAQSMWGGGYYSEKRAIEEALKQCKSSNCQLITTFFNTCAVVVEPDRRAKSLEDIFVAFDNDDKKAAPKAMQACEAEHGHNKCSYWQIKRPFCTGYDYSIYGQH